MNLQIFSGRSNLKLGKGISDAMRESLGEIFFHNFPSGESYCQFKTNIRGSDVFLIQGITKPANENLMDLLVMADAARRASAGRITAVIPYFGYARQDRKDKSRVPITAKLVMNLLEAAGIQRVVTMDLHAAQIGGFTDLPFDHLSFQPVLSKYLMANYGTQDIVVVAPDVGAVKRAEHYAKSLACDIAFLSKTRVNDETVSFNNFVGNVKGMTAIIVDDLTESCGTLTQAAQVCKDNGAKEVICAVTHAALTGVGFERLHIAVKNGIVDKFIFSDTIKDADPLVSVAIFKDQCVRLSVAEIFGKAINNISKNLSVSELFD